MTVSGNAELIERFEWGWQTLYGDQVSQEVSKCRETRHFDMWFVGKPDKIKPPVGDFIYLA